MAERLRNARALAAAVGRGLAAPASVLLVATVVVLATPARKVEVASASTYLDRTFGNTGTGPTGGSTVNSTGTLGAAPTVTSGYYVWTVPATGRYRIEAIGAQGASKGIYTPGFGASVTTEWNLTSGQQLRVYVGQQGTTGTNGGGGGGATGVIAPSGSPATILAIGGGGGGAGINENGKNATTTSSGVSSSGAGGSSGNGGGKGYTLGDCGWGGGGGGYLTDGYGFSAGNDGGNPGIRGAAGGGKSYANGGAGSSSLLCNDSVAGSGGFGVAGGGVGHYGGGGGGGYSGGGGGQYTGGLAGTKGGGGGGSYVAGALTGSTSVSSRSGHGQVVIILLAPAPTTFQARSASPTNTSTLVYDVVFSESVTGLDATDFSVSGTSSGWSVSTVTGSGDTYVVTLSHSSPPSGSVILTMLQNAVSGGSSLQNGPGGDTSAATVTIDVDPPGASIGATPASPAAAMSLTFGVSFTESVSGIASGDFSNGGSAQGCVFTPSATSGSSVNVVVTQCEEGTLQLVIAANGVTDAAGNLGPVAAVSSSSVTLAASGLAVTAASHTVNYGGSWTDSYSQSGLSGGDSITVSYSYSGTTNDGASYGPSSTKPTEGGTYSIIPSVSYGVGNTNRYSLTRNNGTLAISRVSQATLSVTSTAATYGQSLSLTTGGGSGTGVVSWQVVSGTCSVSGSSLTPGNAGSSCVVKATKAQDGNYLVQSSADTTVTVARSAQPALTVSSTTATYGEILQLTTSGGGGTGAVSWQVVSGTCSVVGNDLTTGNVGSLCVVRATKAQDTNYLVRSSSDTTVTVAKAPQTGFTVTSNTSFTTGSSLSLTASGGQSGGVVTWALTSGACTLTGTTLTASRGGLTCVVEATRAGNSNYLSASDSVTITVNKVVQVLTFRSTPPASPVVGGSYTVSVDSDASLAVTVAVTNQSSAVCSISAGVVSFTGVGSCVISASQSGNDVYAAAAASQSITVTAAPVPTTIQPVADQSQATPSQTTSPPTTTPIPPVTTTVPRRTSPSSSTTTTTTTTTTVPSFGSGEVGLEAGETTAMVKGQKVKVEITNDDGNLVVKLPNNVMVKVGPPKGSSSSARINADGVLAAYARDEVEVTAEGFVPGTTYRVMMYSTPVELSRGEVSASGDVTDVVVIPDESESGDHTLVVEGVGEGDEVVAVSLGFTVLERSDNTWAAIVAITAAMMLALLGGRPVWRRRRDRAASA